MSEPLPQPIPLTYAAPPAASRNLRNVASRQRAINLCILAYLILVGSFFTRPSPAVVIILGVLILVVGITGAVYIFLLSLAVYSTAVGIVLGVLTLIPYLGIIPLLIVNRKATKILKSHGVHVGLLGANPSSVPSDI